MLVLLLLGVGALAYFSGRHSHSEVTRVPLLPSGKTITSGAPSPLVVLDGFLRVGSTPPPEVILCAIAEAELMGRVDVANELVRAFVLPVVEGNRRAREDHPHRARHPHHHAHHAHHPNPGALGPGGTSEHDGRVTLPWEGGVPGFERADIERAAAARPVPAPQAPLAATEMPRMPGTRGSPRAIARAEDARVEILSPPSPSAAAPPRSSPHAGTITVSGRSSPIDGIGTEEWSEFVTRVAREQPTFMTAHHVGQFRQRRDRLAELGIDPSQIARSPDAQVAALDADMRDAYGHADESGLIAEYRGVSIEIPTPDPSRPAPIEVTLSGVLGVIQAAGLEGAAGWFESPSDRVRFPHTTRAFMRTNGVF